MNLDDAIKGRTSVRKWTNQPIADNDLEELVEAASHAPQSCDRQSMKFLAVRDRESIRFLCSKPNGGIGFAHNCALAILVLANLRTYTLPIERHTIYLDGAAAMENLLLKAHEKGIGATWLEWTMTKRNEDAILGHFRIPRHYRPISTLALGYPKEHFEKPARRKPREFIIFEKFENTENVSR